MITKNGFNPLKNSLQMQYNYLVMRNLKFLIRNKALGNILQFATSFSTSNYHHGHHTTKETFYKKLTIEKLELKDKRVLMRVDFNVPIKDGIIGSNQKIIAALQTIQYAVDNGAKSVVLISHLGRPNGQKNDKYSLKPVAIELRKLLKRDILFLPDCIGGDVENKCQDPPKGTIILLENLRFHAEEEGKLLDSDGNETNINDEKIAAFRQALCKLGDVYVNDAFGAIHRPHSSIIAEGFGKKAAGFLISKELQYFSEILHKPTKKPALAILGGAKVSEKLPLIMNLIEKVNDVIIGGGMALTFHKALADMQIGNSIFADECGSMIKNIIEKASINGVELYLPVDYVCGSKLAADAKICNATVNSGIPRGYMGLDIGHKSRDIFHTSISAAKLIIWNGPLGVYEIDAFACGSKAIIDAIISATEKGATSVVAGGDTATCCKKFKATAKVSHVSTGGGAVLQLLEGRKLPGIEALSNV